MGNQVSFRISAALKDLIGKELITDEFVAVFELVKNSFDADASEVEVIFENNYQKDARIIIKDNGKGMNYNDLKNKWLFVAYSAKRLKKENEDYRDKIKYNRVFAGAKGVGRFSCDRLGKYLNLISIKNEENPRIENLVVNWEDFENVDDEEFVDIKVTHHILESTKYNLKSGTVLEISGLRDAWDRNRILNLKKSLAKLINPNQNNDSSNFKIKIIADEEKLVDDETQDLLQKVNGEIKNPIFETLGIKTSNIIVEIKEDGKLIETTLNDRGDKIYHLKERNIFYNSLKNITIHLFQLNRTAKANFTRLMGLPPVQYGSVFMYKNGFRIYPYGEEKEDSLGLERRKQQGYNRNLGTRDLMGRIEINGEQPELRETTSRDGGLMKTTTYENLIRLFYDYALKPLENYVVNVIRWGDERIIKETGEVIPALMPHDVKIQILELISGFVNSKNVVEIEYDKDFLQIISTKQESSVDKIVKNITKAAADSKNPEIAKEAKKIGKAIRDLKSDVKTATQRAETSEKEKKQTEKKLEAVTSQKNFLLSDISDDTKNLESILHHIGLTTNFIRKDIENLVKALNNKTPIKGLQEIIVRISNQNEKINSFSKYFKKVNFNIHKTNLNTDIVPFINEYIENVYKLRDDLRINRELLDVKISTQSGVIKNIKFNPIDIIIVIDNLISNSSKNEATAINISWQKEEQKIKLIYSDNGTGIDPTIIDNIFEFGFTTSRRGSGIGLFHVQKIIEKLNGSIEVNPKVKSGSQFVITFN